MHTVTSKLPDPLAAGLDRLIAEGWYANRSDAIRDAVRELVRRRRLERLEAAIDEDIQWGLRG